MPATSANLGPGYDSFGLALGLWDEVTATRSAAGLTIDVTGIGADTVPRDESHLVVVAAARAFTAMGQELPPLALHCVNRIPHGGGLGSSAAAIVAGILLARELTADMSTALSDEDVFALATEMEGHPDNVAPALFGGFTLAWVPTVDAAPTPGSPGPLRRARAVCLTPHPTVRALVLSAQAGLQTSTARAVLPEFVPHRDAALNSAHAALLTHALTCEPELLYEGTEDRLHQQYRADVMPRTAALLSALRTAGHAATLSGAGPSILVLGTSMPDLDAFDVEGFRPAELVIPATGVEIEVSADGADPVRSLVSAG